MKVLYLQTLCILACIASIKTERGMFKYIYFLDHFYKLCLIVNLLTIPIYRTVVSFCYVFCYRKFVYSYILFLVANLKL